MLKARKLGCLAPVIYHVEHEAAAIYMEEVQGRSVKAAISSGDLSEEGAPCWESSTPLFSFLYADVMTLLAVERMFCVRAAGRCSVSKQRLRR